MSPVLAIVKLPTMSMSSDELVRRMSLQTGAPMNMTVGGLAPLLALRLFVEFAILSPPLSSAVGAPI